MLKRNVVELVGNLVDNPEFKDMGDFKVANFFLAADRVVDLNDGQSADFIPIVCKNDLAVAVDTYARKGRRIFVDGRLQVRTYNDDQGNRRWVTEVIAHRIQYLDAPPEDVVNGNQGNRNSNNQGSNNQGNSGGQRTGNRGNYNNNSNRSGQNQANSGNRNGGRNQSGNGNYGNRGNGSSNQHYGNSGGGNQRYGNSGGNSQGQSKRSYSQSGSGGSGGGRMPWE